MRLLTLLAFLGALNTTYGQDSPQSLTDGQVPTTFATLPIPTYSQDPVIDPGISTDYPSATDTSSSPASTQTSLPPVTGYNLRILPLGDSITWGVGSSSNTGYRGQIYQNLVDGGNNVTMIGTVTGGNISQPLAQGIWGALISEIQAKAPPVLAERPNIILLHAGTNNFGQGKQIATVAAAEMSKLLDTIYTACPDVTVVLSQIIPLWGQPGNINLQQYNAMLVNITAAQLQGGRHAVLVDQYTPFTSNVTSPASLYCSVLNTHPNNAGYNLIAGQFMQGLQQAAAIGWISDPVPVNTTPTPAQNRRRCYTMPNWSSQGQIFNGAGLGPSLIDGSTCVKGIIAGRCACTYSDGTFLSFRAVGTNCSAMSYPVIRTIQFADINGDGLDDLIYVSKTGGISVYLNTGSNFIFTGNATPPTGTRREYVQMADVDGDGRADWLLVQPSGSILGFLNTFSNGVLSWSPQGLVFSGILGVPGASIKLMDANGDMKADVCVVSDTGSISCKVNKQYTTAQKLTVASKATQITPASFNVTNRDNVLLSDVSGTGVRTDLLSIDRKSGSLALWWGRWNNYNVSPGSFTNMGVTLAAGLLPNPSNTMFADINGDARKDIVSVDPLTSAVSWWRSDCGMTIPVAAIGLL